MKILIVGNREGTNIGGCLETAAQGLQLNVQLLESQHAFEAPLWIRRLNWWFLGRRPPWLGRFSRDILQTCRQERPQALIVTGITPPDYKTLSALESLGVRRINYLTDDPWNPAHQAAWFLKALPFYDNVFSPRRSNMEDLRHIGCREISYLPFGYAPEFQSKKIGITQEFHKTEMKTDIVFVGSADPERTHYITALIKNGFKVGLYGSFWDRFRETRGHSAGQVDVGTMHRVISNAKVALCLVRRANRDGHSMRTFEIPAIGTCMLTEETQEHREFFGEDMKAVSYFQTIPEMLDKLRWLLTHENERYRLAWTAHRLVLQGRHTYKDRLITMLAAIKNHAKT